MNKMKIIDKVLFGLYLICGGMYLFGILYSRDISKLSSLIWVVNTIIMFSCAKMNEERADRYSKLYFDLMEKDFKKECDKYKELMKKQ